ncbi:unnamed protein product [Cochlearia groenlandica]
MNCLSHYFSWDQPIPDMDMIIHETNSFLFDSQPQPLFHQPLFLEEAPSQTLLNLNHFDSLYDPFLPPQEIFIPNPKTEIFIPNPKTETFDETHNLDYFLPTPKRQRLSNFAYHGNDFSNVYPSFFNPYNGLDLIRESSIFPGSLVPDMSLAFKVGKGDESDTMKPSLSSQSIAARERRRRIAEKTHELGKLVPGGQKLNTAEMFQVAAKYVKFLQSQVGILELMQNTDKTKCESNVEIETRVLLESEAIQEKLSSKEVCLVPCEMVKKLKSEEAIWRNPKISREINKLLSTAK